MISYHEGIVKMERTLRDVDIIRQSSLKAAVEIMTGFQNKIEIDGTKIVSMTLSVADQFTKWVMQSEEEEAQGIDYLKMVKDECHKLQAKLGIPETDWDSQCPFATAWEHGGVQLLVERLRQHIKNQLTGKKHVDAFEDLKGYDPFPQDRQQDGGNGNRHMTDKQRNYISGLLGRTGQKKPATLSSYTSQQASALIETLKGLE